MMNEMKLSKPMTTGTRQDLKIRDISSETFSSAHNDPKVFSSLTVNKSQFESEPDQTLVPADPVLCSVGFNYDGADRSFYLLLDYSTNPTNLL